MAISSVVHMTKEYLLKSFTHACISGVNFGAYTTVQGLTMRGTLAEHRIEVSEQLLGPRVQMTENWRHRFLGIPQMVQCISGIRRLPKHPREIFNRVIFILKINKLKLTPQSSLQIQLCGRLQFVCVLFSRQLLQSSRMNQLRITDTQGALTSCKQSRTTGPIQVVRP